jgi:hypothetical protein
MLRIMMLCHLSRHEFIFEDIQQLQQVTQDWARNVKLERCLEYFLLEENLGKHQKSTKIVISTFEYAK